MLLSTFREPDPPLGPVAPSSTVTASSCSTAMPTSGRRQAGWTAFSSATRAIFRAWRCCSTASDPLLLGSNVRDDNSIFTVDLTNPDICVDQDRVLPKDMLHVVRTVFLWRDTAYQRLRMQNHGERTFDVRLTLTFASDFADLFEVRGLRRERRGAATAQILGESSVALNYLGRDSNRRRTMLLFEPAPEQLSSSVASYAFELQPDECRSIIVTVKCGRGVEEEGRSAAVSQGPARGVPRTQGREPRHGHDLHVEPGLQRGAVPLDG